MQIDPNTMAAREFYAFLANAVVPRPIAWISTISSAGVANLAPYSFSNAVGSNPPAVMFSGTRRRDGSHKDSIRNVRDTGEFVFNIVNHDLAEKMNHTSVTHHATESEFEAGGLTRANCVHIRPPRVAEAPVSLECVVHGTMDVGEGPGSATLVVGRVVMMHIHENVLKDGHVDAAMLDAIGRLGGSEYCTTRDRFSLSRPE